jgi:hypothetical protein
MTNNNDFSHDQHAQFVLSYELLCLLRWLTEHDTEKLKRLITKALASRGLQENLRKLDNPDGAQQLDDIQNSIIDFFGLMESLLGEALQDQLQQKARAQNLMPALDHIDGTLCDDDTVRSSLEKTTSKLDHNPQINPKEQLFKELLKRWKPHKKSMLN